MTGTPSAYLDELITSWEAQQAAYIRHRDQRFDIILDALSYARPDMRSVLDLGAGLGSFSKRILQRFPDVTVRALDYDPALLALARHNLAGYLDRVTFVEADLRDSGWQDAIGDDRPDAIVSSTALHWLHTDHLVHLYVTLAGVLGSGGLFFNADHMSHPAGAVLAQLSTADDQAVQQAAFGSGVPDWDGWWKLLRETEGFADLVAERDRRFADRSPENPDTSPVLHAETLRVAGFGEAGTAWQYFDDYVVYGVR